MIIKICMKSYSEVSNLTHFHIEKTGKVTEHKETLFHCEITKPCPRLPREAMESPFLKVFKSCPDTNLDNRPWVVLLEQKVGPDDLPSTLNHSVDFGSVGLCDFMPLFCISAEATMQFVVYVTEYNDQCTAKGLFCTGHTSTVPLRPSSEK